MTQCISHKIPTLNTKLLHKNRCWLTVECLEFYTQKTGTTGFKIKVIGIVYIFIDAGDVFP